VIATIGGTRQIVTITQKKIVGVDATTGALLWERPYASPSTTNSNTPIMYGQTIIVSGNGGPTVAFTAAKTGATWTTTNVWENPEIPLRLTNMALVGDTLFGLTNRNAGQYFAVRTDLFTRRHQQRHAFADFREGNGFMASIAEQ